MTLSYVYKMRSVLLDRIVVSSTIDCRKYLVHIPEQPVPELPIIAPPKPARVPKKSAEDIANALKETQRRRYGIDVLNSKIVSRPSANPGRDWVLVFSSLQPFIFEYTCFIMQFHSAVKWGIKSISDQRQVS